MGNGTWSSNQYQSATQHRAQTGQKDFDYDDKVKSGQASGIHPTLDPRTVAGPSSPLAGQVVRESRDNPDHPNSLPVAVFFDVTGSMGEVPLVLQKKLTTLMDVIHEKAALKDVQILMGAIGDATCDRYPFQVGQFESDNRFDEALRNIILEGGGGGQMTESYGLAYRFAAHHTATDSFEKRGKKGYLFTMGDEAPWPRITKREVQQIFGVTAEADDSIEVLLSRAREKWEVYHINLVGGTSYGRERSVVGRWKDLLNERLITVEDADLVCEVIAGIIHMMEGAHDVDKVVDDIGLSGAQRTSVKNALVPVAATRGPRHVTAGAAPKRSTRGGSAGMMKGL